MRLSRRKVPDSLPKGVGLCLFRITQEALRNIAAHSGAGKVSVTLTGRRGSVRLSIKDDGRGFCLLQTQSGLGLITMEELARSLGGSPSLKTRPGEGVELVAGIPWSTNGGGAPLEPRHSTSTDASSETATGGDSIVIDLLNPATRESPKIPLSTGHGLTR